MQKQKKQWTRPQLIVIGRGQPEENVLAKCMFADLNRQGPLPPNCMNNAGNPCQNPSQS